MAPLIPPPDQPVRHWHVSPLVDVVAYHLSWLWILIPLLLAGPKYPTDYRFLLGLVLAVTFVHRNYGLPYVYLDREIFRQYPTRFVLFAGLLMVGFVATPWLNLLRLPPKTVGWLDAALVAAMVGLGAMGAVLDRRGWRFPWPSMAAFAVPYLLGAASVVTLRYANRHVESVAVLATTTALAAAWLAIAAGRSPEPRVARAARGWGLGITAGAFAVAAWAWFGRPEGLNRRWMNGSLFFDGLIFAAVAWNVWHTFMQKYGILRVYAAKSEVPLERRPPGLVDKGILFSWFPLLALVIGPAQSGMLRQQARGVNSELLLRLANFMDDVKRSVVYDVALAAAIVFVAVVVALWIRSEWRASRLRNAPRVTLALATTVLLASFLVVDPVKVFIAFGFSHAIEYMVFVWAFQRRRYAQPLPHRPFLQRLLRQPLLYYVLFTLGLGYGYFHIDSGQHFGLHRGGIRPFDIPITTWLLAFTVWDSFVHFYYDGFLWKMRSSQVRASL
jgi:hypothetical protein